MLRLVPAVLVRPVAAVLPFSTTLPALMVYVPLMALVLPAANVSVPAPFLTRPFGDSSVTPLPIVRSAVVVIVAAFRAPKSSTPAVAAVIVLGDVCAVRLPLLTRRLPIGVLPLPPWAPYRRT